MEKVSERKSGNINITESEIKEKTLNYILSTKHFIIFTLNTKPFKMMRYKLPWRQSYYDLLRLQSSVSKWMKKKHGNSMIYDQRHNDGGTLIYIFFKVLGKWNEMKVNNITKDFSIQWLG